jgi:hypothetical protein
MRLRYRPAHNRNKRGSTSMIVIMLVLGLIVFVVLNKIIPGMLGKGSEQTYNFYEGQDDFDKDDVIDLFDKCPCKHGLEENDGCSKEVNIELQNKLDEENIGCNLV